MKKLILGMSINIMILSLAHAMDNQMNDFFSNQYNSGGNISIISEICEQKGYTKIMVTNLSNDIFKIDVKKQDEENKYGFKISNSIGKMLAFLEIQPNNEKAIITTPELCFKQRENGNYFLDGVLLKQSFPIALHGNEQWTFDALYIDFNYLTAPSNLASISIFSKHKKMPSTSQK